MKTDFFFIFIMTVILCGVGTVLPADDTAAESKNEKVYEDVNGKQFYSYKKDPLFVRFKRLKNEKVPMYVENSSVSPLLKYLDFKEFVEIVDGKMGLNISPIRSYDKQKGYVEGFTKNNFFYRKNFYGLPYEMSDAEILRRKELAAKKIRNREERERRRIENEKEISFNKAISNSRDDAKNILNMTYSELTAYFKGYFTEDAEYTENASQTMKFVAGGENSSTTVYLTLKEMKVVGFQFINNEQGLSVEQANVLLYESVGESSAYEYKGEMLFSIVQSNTKNINPEIVKRHGTLPESGLQLVIKTDTSKDNPIIELTVGEFSGIE